MLVKAFYGLNELMKRPYWFRLWVVQEIVLGDSAAILRCRVLRCGSKMTGWTTFCTGLDVLFRRDMYIVKDELLQIELTRRRSRKRSCWHTLSLHLVQHQERSNQQQRRRSHDHDRDRPAHSSSPS
ncbi:hypothetical protein C8A05DRAFT_35365 [Staphylotrichum tortipilum]|uniref:Heterokaryon incompatibility domain-containing protein n=1 Tax=Staphylotrichum tortipilum TaxID=2831512 RepID=A0AAN6MHI5_9PEZI|nr:hypothetical protein C8A05DRAFT_35365 [Staphylotrichum longicolle]